MKLKKRLFNKPFCNELHFFVVGLILFLFSLKHPLFYIGLGIYLFFLVKKTRLIIPMLILLFLFGCHLLYKENRVKELPAGVIEDVFVVEDKKETSIIIENGYRLICYTANEDLKPGDRIKARVKISSFPEKSYENEFDAKEYYKYKEIYNRGTIESYEYLGQKITIKLLCYQVKAFYKERLGETAFRYVNAIIFGEVSFDKEIKSAYSSLMITHILAISGLHILFFYQLLKRIFQKLFQIEGSLFTFFILGIYLVFIGFPISAIRAYLFLVLGYFNKKGRVQYTRLDIFSIAFLFLALINPFSVFQQGFILSFLVSFILIFKKDIVHTKSIVLKHFYTSLLCIFITLPFLINQSNDVSFSGIFFSFVFTLFFSKLLFPILILTLFFPFSFWNYLFVSFDTIIIIFSKLLPSLRIASLSFYMILVYYLTYIGFLVGIMLHKRRYCFIFILFILLLSVIRVANPFYHITFIDVGQGDSIVIELPNNSGNVVIDSYGKNVDYLKSIGIKRIDYLFLSHFDKDHIETVEELAKNMNIKEIVYSPYEDINEIKEVTGIKKTPAKVGMVFCLQKLKLQVLGPIRKYNSSNANSLVLKVEIKDFSFLFTGDMTEEAERDLVQAYKGILKSNVLKVGHHGSSSSSSMEFLQYVLPDISVISVGKNNSYHLPNQAVLERLQNFGKVYLTKDYGNITIRIDKDIRVLTYR